MKILLATGNRHKKEECVRLLDNFEVVIPKDLGLDFDPVEDGRSYLENSLIKCRTLFEMVSDTHAQDIAVLADDSGISVPALGGEPGIRSARYGFDQTGRFLDSAQKNELLLHNAAHLKGPHRRAFFVCCMTLMVSEYRVYSVQETMEGILADKPEGQGGFGYDPILFIEECGTTVASLTAADKDRLSHRGKAVQRIKVLLDSMGSVRGI